MMRSELAAARSPLQAMGMLMPCVAFFGPSRLRRGVLTTGFWATSMLVGMLGCASTADDSDDGTTLVDTSDVPDEAPPANTIDNGQTGSIGSSECDSAADCEQIAQGQLDELESPQPSGISLQAQSCEVAS